MAFFAFAFSGFFLQSLDMPTSANNKDGVSDMIFRSPL